jgi:HEAT repeat protein
VRAVTLQGENGHHVLAQRFSSTDSIGSRWPTEINRVTVPYGRSAVELRSLVMAATTERWAAIAALAHSSDARALEFLGELASFPDPHVRGRVLEWIGKRPDGAELAHAILERFRDPSVVVVRTAALVAGELAISEARTEVLALLKNNSPTTREASLEALKKLWQPSDFETIVAMFKRERVEKVRRTAAWTLYATRSADRASALVELWRADSLPRHRVWACQIAEEFPQLHFRADIVHLAEDLDGHVRKAARRALEAIERAV